MFGVGMSLPPWNPYSPQPTSSLSMTRMLGFLACAWAEEPASTAKDAHTESSRSVERMAVVGPRGVLWIGCAGPLYQSRYSADERLDRLRALVGDPDRAADWGLVFLGVVDT